MLIGFSDIASSFNDANELSETIRKNWIIPTSPVALLYEGTYTFYGQKLGRV